MQRERWKRHGWAAMCRTRSSSAGRRVEAVQVVWDAAGELGRIFIEQHVLVGARAVDETGPERTPAGVCFASGAARAGGFPGILAVGVLSNWLKTGTGNLAGR